MHLRKLSMRNVNSRHANRYRVHGVVKFTWAINEGELATSTGHARDISSTGIYIRSLNPLAVGTSVHVEVMLPGLRNREGARLSANGYVVRSEGNGFAIAAQTKFGFRSHRENKFSETQSLPGVEPGVQGKAAVPADLLQAGTATVVKLQRK